MNVAPLHSLRICVPRFVAKAPLKKRKKKLVCKNKHFEFYFYSISFIFSTWDLLRKKPHFPSTTTKVFKQATSGIHELLLFAAHDCPPSIAAAAVFVAVSDHRSHIRTHTHTYSVEETVFAKATTLPHFVCICALWVDYKQYGK